MVASRLFWDELNPSQRLSFVAVTWTLGSLTMLGTLVVMALHLFLNRTRTIGKRIIFLLAACDFFTVATFLISPSHPPLPGPACDAQGFLQDIFTDASIFFTASYAWYLRQLVQNPRSVRYSSKWAVWYYVLPFVYPCLVAIFNISFRVYAPSGFWCWVGQDHEIVRWCEFYLVLIIVFIFNTWIYVSTLRALRRHKARTRGMTGANRSEIRLGGRISLYLLIFIVCWIPGFINRFQNVLDPNDDIFALNMTELAFVLIQGFLNSLVYSANFLTNRSRRKRRIEEIERLSYSNPDRAAALRRSLQREENDDDTMSSLADDSHSERPYAVAMPIVGGGGSYRGGSSEGSESPGSSSQDREHRKKKYLRMDEALATPLIARSGAENLGSLSSPSTPDTPVARVVPIEERFAVLDRQREELRRAMTAQEWRRVGAPNPPPPSGNAVGEKAREEGEPAAPATMRARVGSAEALWDMDPEEGGLS